MATEEQQDHMGKISQIIKDLSADQSFTGEAMRQFLELKDEVDSQESVIRYLRRHNKEKDEELKKLTTEIRGLEGHVESMETERDGWRARESELLDREGQMTRIEVTLACETKRVEDHQTMVGLIFRNELLRKITLGSELSHQPGHPEVKDEYGSIRQHHQDAGFESTPVKKDELETKE